jgi:hypothetical protein
MNTAKILKQMIFIALVVALGLSACIPGMISPVKPDLESINTAAAQTVAAQITLSAGQTAVAQLTAIAPPTKDGGSTYPATETSIPTLSATATLLSVQATATPTATTPPKSSATATSIPCDRAQFIQDITIPDGTVTLPGSQFKKVWRIKNVGSCTWDGSYGVVFNSGDRMSSYTISALPGVVPPGQMIDISLELTSPNTPGHYRSNWKLINAAGQRFGLGANADIAFWTDINVIAYGGNYAFDFAANMCAAVWRSNAGYLPCPGDKNTSAGSVILLNSPVLETGKHENETTLWTRPQETRGGWISGAYPSYTVKPGDHFMADIGCLEGSQGCDVTFSLDYQVEGKAVKNLGTWREAYDGKITRLEIDLSSLVGKNVHFILGVTNHGTPSQADAFWLVPSIRNQPGEPTPTATVSPTAIPYPTAAIQAAITAVARESGMDPKHINVYRVVTKNWKDSCLGLDLPDQTCQPMNIPGYRIIMIAGFLKYEAHTNLDGSVVFITKI